MKVVEEWVRAEVRGRGSLGEVGLGFWRIGRVREVGWRKLVAMGERETGEERMTMSAGLWFGGSPKCSGTHWLIGAPLAPV